MLYGVVQLVGQFHPLDGVHGVIHAVSSAFRLLSPQHHLRVVEKILVDREAFLGPAGLRPVRGNVQRTVPLLQEENIRNDLSSGICLERIVWQADGSQQLGPLGQIPAHGGILGVHCITGGHKGHHAARPHLVQRFCEKVVVNVETQFVVGFVVHLILSERDVTDGKVIEVPPVGGLKSCHRDVGLGVELLCNPAADGIQFHAVQTAAGHALRQHPEEIAHTAGRFQNVAGAEAHLLYRAIDGADDDGAGVVGVEGGGPGRFIFLRGQKLFQFGVLLGPGSFGRVEGIRHTAPAHIAGQHFLLFRRSLPGGFLQVFQQLDRRHIGLVLGLGAALAQMLVGDAEVLGVAAQVVPVFLIGRLLGSPLVGESLPLAIHRDGNRVVRLFLRLRVRRRFGRRGFRPANVQPFHHHVIGQMVFVAGVNSHRLGVERRCLGGFFNSGSGFNRWFGLLLHKAVHLAGIQPAQQRRDFIPAEEQHGQPLFVRVQHFQLNAFGYGAVVGGVAGLQLHRLDDVRIGPAQPQGDLPVALAGTQQFGKLRLVWRADQAVGQHVPQVLVRRVGIDRQELGVKVVAIVCPQKLLEPFPALGPVDGVRNIGGQQLHRVLPQLGDLVLLIVQINRITHMVRGCCGGVGGGGFCFRDSLPDGFIFLIRYGNIHLMGRFAAADGEGVSLAGDGLAGQVECCHLRLGSLIRVVANNTEVSPLLQIVDRRAIVGKTVRPHCAVHIALGHLLGFLQRGVFQALVKTVLEMVVDHYLIPASILLVPIWLALLFCQKFILLDELCDPALHFGPGQGRPLRAVRAYRKRGFAIAAVKLMGQPCGGIFFPRMVFHVADNGVLAFDLAVPVLDSSVNVIVRKWAQQLMEFGIGLVNDLAMQAVTELRHIGVEPDQFQVAGI